jgi:hypothetical protein
MGELDPNVIASAVVVSLVGSVIAWLRGKAKTAKLADWAELADSAVDSLVDDAELLGSTLAEAREMFESAAYAALAIVGVPKAAARPIVTLAAEHGVQEFRRRLGRRALAKAMPELANAAAGAAGAFNARPVVEVKPEDVRMELTPWGENSSATTEPAPQGLPPLPPSGLPSSGGG